MNFINQQVETKQINRNKSLETSPNHVYHVCTLNFELSALSETNASVTEMRDWCEEMFGDTWDGDTLRWYYNHSYQYVFANGSDAALFLLRFKG